MPKFATLAVCVETGCDRWRRFPRTRGDRPKLGERYADKYRVSPYTRG